MDTRPHYDSPLHMMEVRGGGFVRSLAACYYAADPENRAKLRAAFGDYFAAYERQYIEHQAAQAKRVEA